LINGNLQAHGYFRSVHYALNIPDGPPHEKDAVLTPAPGRLHTVTPETTTPGSKESGQSRRHRP
ncbi:hypothetical protein HPP92_011346, partial [Vanilla planifolia]